MSLGQEDYCYLTTTGRVTGLPREIEIWFAREGDAVYMLSGGRDRSDWVRNLQRRSDVRVRIGPAELRGRARIVTDDEEDARARRLLLEKYSRRTQSDLSRWGREALPVAVDIEPAPATPGSADTDRSG